MMTKCADGGALFLVFFGIILLCQAVASADLLGDASLVRKEIDCVLKKGPCDKLGRSLKASLGEVLRNDCRNCNQRQMVNALKIIEFMEKHHQSEWSDVLEIYQQNPQRRNFQLTKLKNKLQYGTL